MESKWNETFAMIFLGPEDNQETRRLSRRSHEAATRTMGAAPPLWAPHALHDLILSPIYTHISPNQQRHPRKHFSSTATFSTHEIPSRDLFWHPAGSGFDHGGLLHQLYRPSDEA